MTGRRKTVLGFSGLGLLAFAWVSLAEVGPLVVYNASPSVPLGFYRVTPIDPLRRGDLLIVPLPERYRSLAVERGYIGTGVPLIKRVAGLPGDEVCARHGVVFVEGKPVGRAATHDSLGRAMPVWRDCRVLREDEFFALVEEVESSFDSRYLGPLRTKTVIGRAVPLWLFGEQ